MRRLLPLLLAAGASAPALAQHQGHQPPPAAEPRAEDAHAGHAAPQPSAADPHAHHAPPSSPPDPHAGHAPAAPPSDTHAGHAPAAPPPDPHAGHVMPGAGNPHAGHAPTADEPAPAPPPAAALGGPIHAADGVWGAGAMAPSRVTLRTEHGAMSFAKVMIDRFEWSSRAGRDGVAWDAEAWHGDDIDKVRLKSEGEAAFGEGLEHGEAQLLWSRAADPWFDLQAGLRQDFGPGPDRTYAVLGVQGLAPYWFEVEAAAFVSHKGEVSARIEAEYDLRITQRLILQPAAEIDLQLQDVPELGLGAGLSTAEAGLRLRYEISPQFAPYVGAQYERAFGDTARFRRAAGERRGGWSLVLGARAWF